MLTSIITVYGLPWAKIVQKYIMYGDWLMTISPYPLE